MFNEVHVGKEKGNYCKFKMMASYSVRRENLAEIDSFRSALSNKCNVPSQSIGHHLLSIIDIPSPFFDPLIYVLFSCPMI